MPWRTKRIFPLFHVAEQRFSQRRRNGVDVFIGILPDALSDVLSRIQGIFKEIEHHTHVIYADIQRGVGINEPVKWQIFVQLVNLSTQLFTVLIPVENSATNA